MIKPGDVLGMNARNQLYVHLNSAKARSICVSKYATKALMANKGIPTAEIYGILTTIEDVNDFNWLELEKNFVIKPTNGHAGKGIVAFVKKIKGKDKWIDVIGNKWDLDDVKLHCFDTLEGQYSTHGSNHKIMIEERIISHKTLLKYSYKGTPDIRVVVFNSVPVMAYVRLPTKESGGRANQNQGAIGVGIDIATGITTYAAAHKTQLIKYLPGTKKKLHGIKIPFWDTLLKTAVKAVNAAKLVYCGVDLFIHEEKGPMVVELNAYPGLSIQIANNAGLRRRLERVVDLNVLDVNHGVKIGQALFAEQFSDKIKAKEGLIIVEPKETILVYGENRKKIEVLAMFNTARYRSAIATKLAEELDLFDIKDLLWFQQEVEEGRVPVVEIKFKLKNRLVKTQMIVSKRLSRQNCKIEIGRKDLPGFLIGIKDQ